MKIRGLPLRFLVCIGFVILLVQVATQSYGNNSPNTPADPMPIPVAWEYAQLNAQTILYEKYTEYSWQWVAGEEGLVGFKGRSEVPVLRDLCHRITTRAVDAKSNKAKNTHILLLDTIGAKGWELVDHNEVIKDFNIDSTAKTSKESSSPMMITRKWLFKRERAM